MATRRGIPLRNISGIPDQMWECMRERARAEGRTVSEVTRSLWRSYLEGPTMTGDDLPSWSVVLDREQIAWQKTGSDYWWSPGDEEETYRDLVELDAERGPLRVIWRGRAEQRVSYDLDPDKRVLA